MIKHLFALFLLATTTVAFAQDHDHQQHNHNQDKEIVFASDTQDPLWIETILLKAHNNKSATQALFQDISQRNPSSVFLLGDVVSLGYSDKKWKMVDPHLQKMRSNGVEVHAALGNHEIMGNAKKGERKFQERFPDHVRTGYVKIVDSVAVILLNSNFSKLTKTENEAQVEWYKQTLAQLDADPSIHFIISGCHHSPYTNSKVVGASKDVQNHFVAHFLASEKSRLFVSGHCHGYEHFNVEEKEFMVIGGGGGLNQPLKIGEKAALEDMAHDYKPLFHYISVKRMSDHLQITSHKINNEYTAFYEGRSSKVFKAESVLVANAKDATAESTVSDY